jgi:hypothetical protein
MGRDPPRVAARRASAALTGRHFRRKCHPGLGRQLIEAHETAVSPLTAEEIFGVQSPVVAVLLSSIADPTNVNRLLDEQKLTFAPQGLTVVYGDNASGKSGYARIIKAVVGARHREAIHPDVFSDPSSVAQSALIAFDRGGVEQTATWPLSPFLGSGWWSRSAGLA